ncbi:TadE-like protein [Keratinibaculum paraultunense]|uniref:TadE-like protein n=1 Tax=Keratinibaculum paraultunense TaxID=1278232 RepID=A0A4R3L066_9FIRM|nr:TadE family protein [Keratinibaculum paraultunense]QQY80124.1 pilus assembly protein [Keratinibaculum paraultunense]TCS91555.1 TadE-like protein [Keratinibaculum paraultunense]
MKRLIKHEKGTSLVEFALVLPIMLIMLGLICDMGRAVHAKINLQHLTGEIQRAVILYEEAGATDGIKRYSNYKNADQIIRKVIEENTNLDKSKLRYTISRSESIRRVYTGHYYNYNTGRFDTTPNWNDLCYVTVSLEYELPYIMFITKTILGDSMILSEAYKGMMYLGGG